MAIKSGGSDFPGSRAAPAAIPLQTHRARAAARPHFRSCAKPPEPAIREAVYTARATREHAFSRDVPVPTRHSCRYMATAEFLSDYKQKGTSLGSVGDLMSVSHDGRLHSYTRSREAGGKKP